MVNIPFSSISITFQNEINMKLQQIRCLWGTATESNSKFIILYGLIAYCHWHQPKKPSLHMNWTLPQSA